MDEETVDDLFAAMSSVRGRPTPEQQRATLIVYRLLAQGERVTPRRIGDATGWNRRQADRFLATAPWIDVDSDGCVVACCGLTRQPTDVTVSVEDGGAGYAVCAWDGMLAAILLNQSVVLRARCPQTAEPICVEVAPSNVGRVTPLSTVITFPPPATFVDDLSPQPEMAESVACSRITFLSSPLPPEHDWPVIVLELGDAFHLAHRVMQDRYGTAMSQP